MFMTEVERCALHSWVNVVMVIVVVICVMVSVMFDVMSTFVLAFVLGCVGFVVACHLSTNKYNIYSI